MPTTPTPPACPTHRSRYVRGCAGCQLYRRRLVQYRSRQIAYGQWRPKQKIEPVQAHIRTLLQAGMSLSRIAARAGVDGMTVGRVYAGRNQSIFAEQADAILGVHLESPGPTAMIQGVGASRRLRALARAGYSISVCARLLARQTQTVYLWRAQRRQQITLASHQAVDTLYRQLWDTEGASSVTRRVAEQLGWFPFDAWTESTIDDPTAQPYSDRVASSYIDWERLDRVLRRDRPRTPGLTLYAFMDLSEAERQHLYDEHTSRGLSDRAFRDKYRPVPADELRRLAKTYQEAM